MRAALVALALLLPLHAEAGQRGKASWYGPGFAGRPMANGERFRPLAPVVAHRRLPLGTKVLVRNLRNGKVARATVKDRGPYVPGRILDVSQGVARKLGMERQGLAMVEVTRR
jgi:rare lipoprotein A